MFLMILDTRVGTMKMVVQSKSTIPTLPTNLKIKINFLMSPLDLLRQISRLHCPIPKSLSRSLRLPHWCLKSILTVKGRLTRPWFFRGKKFVNILIVWKNPDTLQYYQCESSILYSFLLIRFLFARWEEDFWMWWWMRSPRSWTKLNQTTCKPARANGSGMTS